MLRSVTATVTTIIVGTTLVLGLPGSAGAASGDFGNTGGTCTGNVTSGGTFVMTGGAATNSIPVAAPSSGVITQVQLSVPGGVASYPVVVKVMRATGVPNEYTTLSQTAVLPATGGVSTFPVQLRVSTGDLLGTYGSAVTRGCTTASSDDTIGAVAGNSAPGTTATYAPVTSVAIPLVATVEPDVDGDGFSDVSQDLCPLSAKTQAACPVVTLDSLASASEKKITVVVATSHEAPVSLSGAVKMKGRTVRLTGGPTTVAPGTLTPFTLKLSKSLRKALARLPSSRSLKVTLTATATDVIGRTTTDTTKLKLPGTQAGSGRAT